MQEENSLEVADDKVISSDDDSETQKRMELNKHKIDESYLHLIALQTKLNVQHICMSWFITSIMGSKFDKKYVTNFNNSNIINNKLIWQFINLLTFMNN